MAPGHCQCFYQLGDGGPLLANGDVDADHVLALLVDDGVGCKGGLTRLAVADDKFTLAAADRHHGVDGLDARLQGLGNALAFNDTRGRRLNRTVLLRIDETLARQWARPGR